MGHGTWGMGHGTWGKGAERGVLRSELRYDRRAMDGPRGSLSRRCFLTLSTLAGGAALSARWFETLLAASGEPGPALDSLQGPGVRIIRTGCPAHNCGGRCLLRVHVRDGVIVRIDTDDRGTDTPESPQLRACVRGRAYRRRQYQGDRLTAPLKRSGPRGSGAFQPISWDEAIETVSRALARVKQQYGNSAMFVPYGTGSFSQINGRQAAQRLLNLFGGSLGHYNNYSWAAMAAATHTVYGTTVTGNDRRDWQHAQYILMWGWNPSEMRDGTNTEYWLRQARERGA
ncbi:MAG: molybdopterin-dependent oxidoreductase, partial [Vicinamibacterales bacterium]|nr:molybdopterin-dependent oxidoreductase [Vicinamibacterales bacterium]